MNYEYNKVLKFLYFEGYADSYEEAEYLLEDLDDDEFEELLAEMPYQIYGPPPHGPSDAEPVELGKPYQNKKRANNKAEKLNLDIGGHRHFVRKVDEEFKDLTPEKEDRVKKRIKGLIDDISGFPDKTNKLIKRRRTNIIKSGQFRNTLLPGRRSRLKKEAENINKEHQANVKRTEKSAELYSNATDSLINTSVSKDVRDRLPDVIGHLKRSFNHSTNNIRRFQREEFILEYLLLNGYTDNYDSAIAIYESMSDEWVNDILEVFKGEGEEYKQFHIKNHRDPNDDDREAYDAEYAKNEYGGENARRDPREKHNDARGVKKRRGVK